jgi:Aminoglycoside-2''-adenylyltransferase
MLAGEDDHLGAWQPTDPNAGAAWFSSVDAPWWIAGGWALDLYLGRQSRAHADLDVGVLRCDVGRIRERLPSWEMFEAKEGVLTRLEVGESPRLNMHSLWCRPVGATRWSLELMLDDSVDDVWVYRREPSIRRPFSTLIRMSTSGLPYIAPEVQLLYKSKGLRPRDQTDFNVIAPLLDPQACDWLLAALNQCDPGHEWISALRTQRGAGLTDATPRRP